MSLLTSAIATHDLRPMPSISFATSSHPDLFAETSFMQTSYPSCANRIAMAFPIPRLDPVTIAVLLLVRQALGPKSRARVVHPRVWFRQWNITHPIVSVANLYRPGIRELECSNATKRESDKKYNGSHEDSGGIPGTHFDWERR